jgi:hypothetical protein
LGFAAAFVFFFPVTAPAAVAALIGAPMLWLLGGTPRPAFSRAFGAAFLGLVFYMATAGVAVSMDFDLTDTFQRDQLTPDAIIPIALGQCVALAGFAIVSAWWMHRRSIAPGLVLRAFVAGVLTVVLLTGALIGAAWQPGMT